MRRHRNATVLAAVVALALPVSASAVECSNALNGSGFAPNASGFRAIPQSPLGSATPIARASDFGASLILAELGKGALSYVGTQAAGWLFRQIGIEPSTGSAEVSAQLTRIRAEITQTNERLVSLAGSVDELKEVASAANYSNLVAQALPIIAKIKHVEKEILLLRTLTPAQRKTHAREILLYICNNLLDKQTELNERIVGNAPNADNIITGASKAARDSAPFFGQHQSMAARRAVEYYILYETLLLQLRVEWWHAIGKPGSYVKAQVDDVTEQVRHQRSLIKHDLNWNVHGGETHGQFIDKRNPTLVWWKVLFQDTGGLLAPILGDGTGSYRHYFKFYYDRAMSGDRTLMGVHPFYPEHAKADGRDPDGHTVLPLTVYPSKTVVARWHLGHHWRVPTQAEFEALIKGWSGASPAEWLARQTKPNIAVSLRMWDSNNGRPGTGFKREFYTSNSTNSGFSLENGQGVGQVTSFRAGLMLVRDVPSNHYWYP